MNTIPQLLAQVTTSAPDRSMLTSIVVWLFVGLIAGFLGSKIVNKKGDGLVFDIILGLIGAFVGGFLFSLLGINSGASIIMSIVVATVGAIVVLIVYHALIRGTAGRNSP